MPQGRGRRIARRDQCLDIASIERPDEAPPKLNILEVTSAVRLLLYLQAEAGTGLPQTHGSTMAPVARRSVR